MAGETEAVKEIVSHPLVWGSALTFMGWLGNKVFRGMNHRIANAEQTAKNAAELAVRNDDARRKIDEKLFDIIREHEAKDSERFAAQEASSRDRHDELMTVIGDLRTDVAGLK